MYVEILSVQRMPLVETAAGLLGTSHSARVIICSRSRQHGLTRSLVDFRWGNAREGDKVKNACSSLVFCFKSGWAAGGGLDVCASDT
jgi:hypothetical protein